MEDAFLRRLCRWKQYKWENNEQIPIQEELDRENFYFQWTSSPTLDRRQDAQTDAILLEKNLASPTTIFANNGMDYSQELEKIIQDKAMMREKMLDAGLEAVAKESGIEEQGEEPRQ